VGRDRSSTHDPNRPDRCGILHSTDPSQVSCGISSPRAQESNNLRLKIIRHVKSPYPRFLRPELIPEGSQ
jgi:hypothetical protein